MSRWDQNARDPAVLERAQVASARLVNSNPASTFVELAGRCAGTNSTIRHLKLLRVPSTGSTSFLFRMNAACRDSFATSGRLVEPLWDHQAPSSATCHEASISTLQDPCKRIVTVYAALSDAFNPSGSICQRSPDTCRTHWIHSVGNVDGFVRALEGNWAAIMGVGSLSLTRHSSKARFPILTKHLIIAVPQSLYIGNFSLVVCTPCMDVRLPSFARDLGCSGFVNNTAEHLMQREHKGSPGKFELSAAGCEATQRLYWRAAGR